MRVVLDTNVLLAALISPYGSPHRLYEGWRTRRFELVTALAQLDEFKRVSRYPKLRQILPPHRIGTLVNHLQQAYVLEKLPSLPDDLHLDDADDVFLLAMAQAGEADYLVTGDRRAGLLQRGSFGRTRIVTPGVFCARVLD